MRLMAAGILAIFLASDAIPGTMLNINLPSFIRLVKPFFGEMYPALPREICQKPVKRARVFFSAHVGS